MSVETLRECPYDRVARREPLSPMEARRLEEHLATCPTCATLRTLAGDLDASCGEQPGDSARDLALAEAVLGAIAPAFEAPARSGTYLRGDRRRPVMTTAWLAAAALLALATIAVAAAVVARRQGSPMQRVRAHAPAVMPRAPVSPTSSPAIEAPAPTLPVEAPPALAAAPSTGDERPHEPRFATAAEVFAAANARRSTGDTRAAQTLYRELQRRFGDSPEAITSRVSLGHLLGEHGDARGALAQFDSYLARAPEGELAEEALFERGEALMHLHEADAERDAWQRLLQRYPRSIYAARARRRLEALSIPVARPPAS